MTPSKVRSLAISSEAGEKARKTLGEAGAEFRAVDNARWQARFAGLTITLYKSGKIVVQGANGADEFVRDFLGEGPKKNESLIRGKSEEEAWIGVDESGKGDFFGPLVAAAVYMDRTLAAAAAEMGVQDSKKMSDGKIAAAAVELKKLCPHACIVVGPEKYNELYGQFGSNLNKLLAWTHAKAIEETLEKKKCRFAVIDKFGHESLVEGALRKKGIAIELTQVSKGERDMAVAAASVLARAAFVDGIKRLEKSNGIALKKGCSGEVERLARRIVLEEGPDLLPKIAKMHFRTAQYALHGSK